MERYFRHEASLRALSFATFLNSSANEHLTLFLNYLCQEEEKDLRKNQAVQLLSNFLNFSFWKQLTRNSQVG